MRKRDRITMSSLVVLSVLFFPLEILDMLLLDTGPATDNLPPSVTVTVVTCHDNTNIEFLIQPHNALINNSKATFIAGKPNKSDNRVAD